MKKGIIELLGDIIPTLGQASIDESVAELGILRVHAFFFFFFY